MSTSDIIRHNKETILDQWIARVKEQVPEAKEHDQVALRNDVPDLLDDIANHTDAQRSDQDSHNSYDHGQLRATFENYSLSHVIREYRILMDVLLETIDNQGDVSVSDRDKIIRAVTQAVEIASEVFFQDRQEKSERSREEAEKLVTELQEEGQLRDDFIGTVTHDLRNPLANTISLVELLKSRIAEDVTNHKLLDAVQTSAYRADALIRNLLDVNLIKSGASLPVAIQACDIMKVVRASVEAFQENNSTAIRLVAEEENQTGFCDPEMLRRALDNLISNAIKYGEGDVTVHCRQSKQKVLSIAVHNQGNPIPKDQQDKIFSRHYRMRNQSAQQGWGIGLSLVQGIVQAHEGSVSLNSAEGEGTTFTVLLPIHERD